MRFLGYALVLLGLLAELPGFVMGPFNALETGGHWMFLHAERLCVGGLLAIAVGVALIIADVFLKRPQVVQLVPSAADPIPSDQTKPDKASGRRDQCALCGKTKEQVRKLIIGLHGAVCSDCIDLCNDILGHENPSTQHPAD